MVRTRGAGGLGGRGARVTASGQGSASGPQRLASARVIQGFGSIETTCTLLERQRLPRGEAEADDDVARAGRVGGRRRERLRTRSATASPTA